MKNLIIVCSLFVCSLAFANNSIRPSKKVKQELRTEIIKLLSSDRPEVNSDLTTTVDFMINDKNEIVIVDIQSDIKEIKAYVKRKLNYKTINANDVNKGKVYQLPITFVKQ
ncbi:hypothetical protein [uncultured Tenacibaculum sp.]|uniref:hypothetical protein n=1 Tax=uncultured Tenacibaculum sp. TaxID=174713 RepID=UPI002632F2E0|nr:hypothetical protein [uncultured Tenacibaculum sp.]